MSELTLLKAEPEVIEPVRETEVKVDNDYVEYLKHKDAREKLRSYLEPKGIRPGRPLEDMALEFLITAEANAALAHERVKASLAISSIKSCLNNAEDNIQTALDMIKVARSAIAFVEKNDKDLDNGPR